MKDHHPVTLIEASACHAAVLAGMHHVCFAEPWNAAAMAEILRMPGTAGLIASDGDTITPTAAAPGPGGLVLWRRVLDESEILTLAVLPPWRRRGIGGILLRAAMDESARQGAEIMFLEVAADNAGAQALYHRHGFVVIGRRKGYYASADALVLRSDLRAAGVNQKYT